jgi:putative DNA primase/helicase
MSTTEQLKAERAKELAGEIEGHHDFATIQESGEILYRVGGVYAPGAEAIIECEVEEAEPNATNNFAREVVGHIKRANYVEGSQFDRDLDVLNLKNGLLHMGTRELRKHDALYLSRIQIPQEYDPKAACPEILRFLVRVLPDAQTRVNVLEDAANTLIRDARFQSASMYIGAGDNGKSTWFKVLEAFLGRENITNESIHDLAMSRFAAGNIEGKLAVIYPDIEPKEIGLTGKLKAIIAGDRITVEKKGIQGHPITPTCKLFYSANTLPLVNDDTRAWFRRWRITNWTVQIEAAEKDPNLVARLTTPRELSGLLNVLLGFAEAMKRRGGFNYQATPDQVKAEWGDKSDVIQAFINSVLEKGEDKAVEAHALFAEYVKWNADRGFTALSQTAFMARLKTKVPITPSVVKPGGRGAKSIRLWKGVALRDAWRLIGSTGSTGSTGTTPGHTLESDKVGGVREPVEHVERVEPTLTDSALKSAKSIMSRWGRGPLNLPRPAEEPTPDLPNSSQPVTSLWVCLRGDGGPWADQSVAKGHAKLTGHEVGLKEDVP